MGARHRGFSLVELAVVLFIVALLLGTAMFTLSAQTEQRAIDETRRRLEAARELLLAYAIVNGRLPCPATGGTGVEVRDVNGLCTGGYYGGLLPARTIGFQITDDAGFALDAWNNRIRFAVSNAVTGCTATQPNHFTNAVSLKANGITCAPDDLIVCRSATGITPTACGGAANQVMSQNLVAAIVFSVGKNGLTVPAGGGIDEAANLNGDRVFVFHTPNPAGPANGEFDDHFTWLTVGELYGKMIAAGVLP
jgi:prepilin-type N-terminal cleavage/methylation domain-containing protein